MVLCVQPMFGKMVLPVLGGSPAVWNTCLVFFQAALLIGYVYAHLQSKIRFSRQVIIHLGLLICFMLFLPIRMPVDWFPPTDASPVLWLLAVLLFSLGLPFMLLSGTSPLLQRWFSLSGEPGSKDPYFLYAAGNAGSLLGLFSYPILFEPYLSLSWQSYAWSIGYIILFLCVAAAGIWLWKRTLSVDACEGTASAAPTNWLRLKWVFLAAIPSSMLQSVTSFMTTDVAPVPLLWVLPLGVYMLSFILVFARSELITRRSIMGLQPIALIGLSLVAFWPGEWGFLLSIFASLSALFFTAMALHGALVRSRPSADRLTEFFMCLALGGVLGGVFSAIVAPLIFKRFLEFPLMLMLAAMMVPSEKSESFCERFKMLDFLWPLSIAILGAVFLTASYLWWLGFISPGNRVVEQIFGLVLGILLCICYFSRNTAASFSLGLGAYMLIGFMSGNIHTNTIYMERSFNGVFGVHLDSDKSLIMLTHGNVSHGSQFVDPQSKHNATSYYYPGGPLGQLFKNLGTSPAGRSVGVIGLGTGAMASYATPDDHWVFYELHPGIARMAQNPAYFSYLSGCKAKIDVVLGDGRLSLSKCPDKNFDVILLDAFSSDSVPVHLLTTEALNMYLSKLKDDGVIAIHITNRYIDLSRVIGNVTRSSGIRALEKKHTPPQDATIIHDADPSMWAVVSRDNTLLTQLITQGWTPFPDDSQPTPWSDDYSGLFRYIKFR